MLLVVLDAFSRLVGAIVCASLALSIWNVGSRPITRLIRDVVAGISKPSSLLRGIAQFAAGSLFAALAIELVVQALPHSASRSFSIFATGAFLTGLIVESLIGEPLRRLIGIGGPSLPGMEDRGSPR